MKLRQKVLKYRIVGNGLTWKIQAYTKRWWQLRPTWHDVYTKTNCVGWVLEEHSSAGQAELSLEHIQVRRFLLTQIKIWKPVGEEVDSLV